MTTKHQAGVLSIEKLKAFKTVGDKLHPMKLVDIGINHTGLKKVMSFALLGTRNLGIRLNIWQSVEIDLVEDHLHYKVVDINFINNGLATHRVLNIKVIKDNPVSFGSVSVHPVQKKETKNV